MDFAEQQTMDATTNDPTHASQQKQREVRYEHSQDLAAVLSKANLTVLISTYQAGKLAVLGAASETKLALDFHNFDRPMGVASDIARDTLAVAARDRVWFMRNTPEIAAGLEPKGTYDACLLTRSAQVTGEIQAHEMGFAEDELWVVNTLFSCLCSPHPRYSFVPRWRPPFITQLAPEDRCHLNGLAIHQGRPRFVTAMAETDTAAGWRERKTSTGCVIDVDSGQTVARGFAMPHSPRVWDNHVWLLDSGRGSLVRLDPQTATAEVVAKFPGYTRGLAIANNLAFVGLSKIRESSTFDGVPIAESRSRLKCGMAVIDLRGGRLVGQFEFKSGVDEIFDVSVMPHTKMAAMRGPFAVDDGLQTIWVVPQSADSGRKH